MAHRSPRALDVGDDPRRLGRSAFVGRDWSTLGRDVLVALKTLSANPLALERRGRSPPCWSSEVSSVLNWRAVDLAAAGWHAHE